MHACMKSWSAAGTALLLGMWSIHVDGTGEYFGDGRNNDQNHLAGIQYYGLTAGTFINSKDDRAYHAGLAREVYSHNYSENTLFDIGYKFVPAKRDFSKPSRICNIEGFKNRIHAYPIIILENGIKIY